MAEGHAGYVDAFLVVAGSPVGFTIPDGTLPVRAYVSVDTAAIRYRYTGGNPIGGAGGGHLINAGEEFTVEGPQNVKNYRMIRDTSTSANVFYTLEQ